MSEVFVSYKRENLAAVDRLVAGLRSEGIGVWWDQDIAPNAAWEATIENALAAAKLVIVAWSPAAVASENVKAEARWARQQGRLLQVFVETCDPPLFFGERQGVDLTGWSGDPAAPGWRKVVASVAEVVGAADHAFVVAEVEGASLMWLDHRAAMQEIQPAFEALARDAAGRRGGTVCRSAAETFVASFLRPADAIDAASEIQLALSRKSWPEIGALKVRMAIDFGAADRRGDEFVGAPINRCARLLEFGHGGQILITGAVADQLAGEGGRALKALGAHPLDDSTDLVGISQVLVDSLPRDFPPLRLPESHPNNLPHRQTSLIGRNDELAQLAALLAGADLITVTGPGGVGKTRIAIEACLAQLAQHEDGVWLVELAPVSDPAMVPAAVASAMSISIQAGEDPLTSLVERLRARRCLILLDNCEHLIDAAAALAEAVLERAPEVKLLTSSQELLGVPGEQVFRLRSLGEPDAAALFAERAQAADAGFAVRPGNAEAVAAICSRLDGIPLAIEMAAARAPVLGCDGLLQRLDDRFRVLTGGRRMALPRQRTLLATLDWSHSLLDERNAAVFRRLSVFTGGFSLESASEVAADAELDEFEVIDALSDLVSKSLVAADTADNRTRYRLLETARAYALEKLAAAGETLAVQRRHAESMLKLIAPSRDHYNGGMSDDAFAAHYFADSDNIDRAIDWAFAPGGDPQLGIAIVAAARYIFDPRARTQEYIQCLAAAAAQLPAAPEAVRCEFLVAQASAFMLNNQGMPAGIADEAIAAARAFGEPAMLATALNAKGYPALISGKVAEARVIADESLAIAAQLPLSRLTAQSHHLAAYVTMVESGEAAANPLFADVVSTLRSIGAEGLANWFLLIGSSSSIPRNNPDLAIVGLRDVLSRIRPWHMFAGGSMGLAASNLAFELAMRATPADIAEAREVARTFRKVASRGAGGGTVYLYWLAMARLAAATGRPQAAAKLGGYVEELRASQGNALARAREEIDRLRADLGGQLAAAELAAAWSEGAKMSQDEADRLSEG